MATHSIRQVPLHFHSCASPCVITFQSPCAITFQLESICVVFFSAASISSDVNWCHLYVFSFSHASINFITWVRNLRKSCDMSHPASWPALSTTLRHYSLHSLPVSVDGAPCPARYMKVQAGTFSPTLAGLLVRRNLLCVNTNNVTSGWIFTIVFCASMRRVNNSCVCAGPCGLAGSAVGSHVRHDKVWSRLETNDVSLIVAHIRPCLIL